MSCPRAGNRSRPVKQPGAWSAASPRGPAPSSEPGVLLLKESGARNPPPAGASPRGLSSGAGRLCQREWGFRSPRALGMLLTGRCGPASLDPQSPRSPAPGRQVSASQERGLNREVQTHGSRARVATSDGVAGWEMGTGKLCGPSQTHVGNQLLAGVASLGIQDPVSWRE